MPDADTGNSKMDANGSLPRFGGKKDVAALIA